MSEKRGTRWAVAETADGCARLCPLDPDGGRSGPVTTAPNIAEAVRSRPDATRWVWRNTLDLYPRLLAGGLRVERCYDVEAAENLLLGHEGLSGLPRSLAAAWARLHGLAVPADPPVRAVEPQASLFEPGPVPLPQGTDPLEALLAVHADQLARTDKAEHPHRMRLLTAAESAAMLVAAEMNRTGVPWRADIHDAVLTGLLGRRGPGGLEPQRLAELAEEVSAAFPGLHVRPDLPATVIKAFARDGIALTSTRAWELQHIEHPAIEPLLQYKKLYRLHVAHGWTWLRTWVREGRFCPEYLPAGTVTGRWTTRGGGALQIPKVIRRAVVADPDWCLVVADAAQMEPRILAAVSGDRRLTDVASSADDLYSRAFPGDRDRAKIALLGAIYGQTSGDGLKHLADLRRRFPAAVAHVDDAARAGEEGRIVRTHLGRTCPPAATVDPDDTDTGTAPRDARTRGRFTRNFVVQGSAADWAILMLAALRQSLTGLRAELVFFQHDEVIVHCPESEAETVVAAVDAAGIRAAEAAFGPTRVRFPFTTAVVRCYADAK